MRHELKIAFVGGILTVAAAAGIARTDFDGAWGDRADAAAPPAVVKEVLGQGTSAVDPDRVLLLQRRTFAPGSDSGAHPAAGPTVLSVADGTVEFAVSKGAALLTHSGTSDRQTVAAGTAAELHPGDAVFYDQGVVHDVANRGTDPATTLEARLNPVDGMPATPAPTS